MKFPLLLASALPLLASAHDTRQSGPHVHGQAMVQIAVDGNTVEVGLQAPGMGLLAFERAPASAMEVAQLKQAKDTLAGGSWVRFPAAAGCVLTTHEVVAEGFAAATHHQHPHAGFEASLQFRCRDGAKLSHVMVELGTRFPGLQRTVVESTTAHGQARVELQGAQQRVELQR